MGPTNTGSDFIYIKWGLEVRSPRRVKLRKSRCTLVFGKTHFGTSGGPCATHHPTSPLLSVRLGPAPRDQSRTEVMKGGDTVARSKDGRSLSRWRTVSPSLYTHLNSEGNGRTVSSEGRKRSSGEPPVHPIPSSGSCPKVGVRVGV